MAGFLGLFGSKTKYVNEPTPVSPSNEEGKEAFFLEPDEAKSLGDVEFMRKPITLKRTFPKTLNGKGGSIIQEVTSTGKKQISESEYATQAETMNGQVTDNNALNNSATSVVEQAKTFSNRNIQQQSELNPISKVVNPQKNGFNSVVPSQEMAIENNGNGSSPDTTVPDSLPNSAKSTSAETPEKPEADDNMDMFLRMARDLRK